MEQYNFINFIVFDARKFDGSLTRKVLKSTQLVLNDDLVIGIVFESLTQ